MRKIASFSVNHDKISEGIYVSRIDGDVTTYDMRMRKPNMGDYIDNLTIHSLEHMFATYVRNSKYSDNIIYFGPMGCQTGFYLLTRDLENDTVLTLVKDVLNKIINHNGEIFGNTREECGNFRNLNLDAAKLESQRYLNALNSKEVTFKYEE
ncbi:MAG: S-ribosylhomocysteine lyase [Clostridia bacterium]|nr:S-ribosylhomocysteine lyase [Clostridia bacterium]